MIRKKFIIGYYILFVLLIIHSKLVAQSFERVQGNTDVIPLDGIWKFKLDPFFTGINSNGVQLMPQLPETITLPGSTDESGKGYKTQDMTSLRLTRMFEYKGAAWYEKEVFVPATWKNKTIQLLLERAHWETSVWINDKPVGKRESLSTPHIYDISALLQPGQKNIIRIRVDNNMIYNIEYSHAASAETQTNWNGIIGKIALQAFDKVHIEDIQVYPQMAQHSARLELSIANQQKTAIKGTIQLSGETINTTNKQSVPAKTARFSGSDSMIHLVIELPLGEHIQLWDEFNPALYNIQVALDANWDQNKSMDVAQVTFGMRDVSTAGTHFTINGRPFFVRGTVNSAEFPLTGYPYMNVEQWDRIFRVCKEYGLNTMRFHSWCPPEAAFEAADKAGIYLQVENSDWRFTIGKDSAVNRFLTDESRRILKTYGNHPSFVMFCEGNELVGPSVNSFLSGLVNEWKKDTRHLYTGSSGYPVIPENQYNDFYGARPQHWKEGLKGTFNIRPLNTNYDYSDYVAKFKVPMVTHEVGQWCVYPDYNQLSRYTGILKPYNYQLFRESLREHQMIDLASKFTEASGKFQVIQKKEEIESYLRTPGMGGYHLLQLNDFPGQGTAPVGVVDVFWDPKPYVSAKEFSRFQSATVPLLRTASFTWTNDQQFTAAVEFANFGAATIQGAAVHWSLRYTDSTLYEEGSLDKTTIPVGSPSKLGDINIKLDRISQASRLILTVSLDGHDCSNEWSIWVYPQTLPAVDMKGILVAGEWNDKAKNYLQKGGTVLLLADSGAVESKQEPVFSGISWNTVWSGMPPDLLGILCDPHHPALKYFPTSFHSDWQWWDIARHSRPMMLDFTPSSLRPLIQMIPDWNNNRKTGLLLEAKAGNGKLLLCSVDLKNNLSQRPVARQLLYSLESYISSKDFAPAETLAIEMIDQLFKKHGLKTGN